MPWLEELNDRFFRPMESLIKNSHVSNPWFTETSLRFAAGNTGRVLKSEDIVSWLSCYDIPGRRTDPKTVAVVMAGNIPLAGFHDMLCVIISGHKLTAKLSSKDDQLLKMISAILISINSEFEDLVAFEEDRLNNFDAIIATGSDNTSRYFEYYFEKYPHIIRKNRNSAAILDGSETKEDLEGLADDVLRYFGLGCRSVSKIFVPLNYDFSLLVEAFAGYSYIIDHNQWANNYEYQKAIHLIDRIPHLDTGFLLIREENALASPISVLNYEKVGSTGSALELTNNNSGKIQCIAGNQNISENLVPFGKTQEPGLKDYADNIDTMEFLLNL